MKTFVIGIFIGALLFWFIGGSIDLSLKIQAHNNIEKNAISSILK
jgi:hypothetical protein